MEDEQLDRERVTNSGGLGLRIVTDQGISEIWLDQDQDEREWEDHDGDRIILSCESDRRLAITRAINELRLAADALGRLL